MAWLIKFNKHAADDFSKLDNSVKIKIKKFLKKLEERENPRTLGEALEENLSAYWKFRIGDYRMVAEIQDDVFIILVLVVDKRSKVYKSASKRLKRN